jgi:hypothetical protein
MSLATTIAFQPVARMDHLERLAALSESLTLTPQLWDELHGEIQHQLAMLEAEIRRMVTGIRVDVGRTHGDRFFLFSYRTFSMPDSHVDRVVAGMTFTPAGDRVTVEADVSGEQTGDLIACVPTETVASSRKALLQATRESARTLLQSTNLIAIALTDASRNIE